MSGVYGYLRNVWDGIGDYLFSDHILVADGGRPFTNTDEIRKINKTKITFQGILLPLTKAEYEKLAYLCYKFRRAVERAVILKRKEIKFSYKDLMDILPNAKYCEDAIRMATPLAKSQKLPRIKKLFLKSTGNKSEEGNPNIRIDLKNNTVKVRYPFDETWINFKLKVDKRIYQYTFDHYTAAISFREGKINIFISIPFKPEKYIDGRLIASFNLNIDRINMVITSKTGIIKDVKNKHFHCVISPGFPANKAKDIRLQALAKLLDYAKHHNCCTVLFENKDDEQNKDRGGKANRKITKFDAKQFLDYGINMALRRGFRVYLVNPKNILEEAKKVHRELGLDIHTTSAFLLALKFLKYRYPKK